MGIAVASGVPPAAGLITGMAGALQILAALLRLGQWFRAVSSAVIQGILAGVGFLILIGQFHVMIDDAPDACRSQGGHQGPAFGGIGFIRLP